MRVLSLYILAALIITSCDFLGFKDSKEPCPPRQFTHDTTDSPRPECEPFTQIAIDFSAAWSPDGNTIAYVADGSDGKKFGIYLMNADGSDRRLFHAEAADAPAWSPDGQWLAFHQNAHIYKKHVESDSLVQLTFEGRNFHPDWSPDGALIAYNRSICEGPKTCGIWLMDDDGTDNIYIASYGRYPKWHPLESRIWYVTRSVTNEGVVLGDLLWIYSLTNGSKSILTSLKQPNYDNRYINFSPSGSKIVFQSQPGPDSSVPPPWLRQIWVMNSDGSGLKKLTDTGGIKPAWSPDGQWIIYTETHETGRLWRMRPDGSDKQQLTFE